MSDDPLKSYREMFRDVPTEKLEQILQGPERAKFSAKTLTAIEQIIRERNLRGRSVSTGPTPPPLQGSSRRGGPPAFSPEPGGRAMVPASPERMPSIEDAAPASPPPGSLDVAREFMQQIAQGEPCEQLPGGHGPFGTAGNPIPVDGPLGEIKYLARLRSQTGRPLLFHRVGNSASEVTNHTLDIYEVVAADGTQWTTLFMDLYHPRASSLAPPGFTLRTGGLGLSRTGELGYGINQRVEDFPHGLPAAMRGHKIRGDFWAERRAEQVEAWLRESDFRIAARQINRPREDGDRIIVGPMDAQAAGIFQRMKVSELFGTEGKDWTLNQIAALTDRRTLRWDIRLANGEERAVLFDVAEVASPADEGVGRTLGLLAIMVEQDARRRKPGGTQQ